MVSKIKAKTSTLFCSEVRFEGRDVYLVLSFPDPHRAKATNRARAVESSTSRQSHHAPTNVAARVFKRPSRTKGSTWSGGAERRSSDRALGWAWGAYPT